MSANGDESADTVRRQKRARRGVLALTVISLVIGVSGWVFVTLAVLRGLWDALTGEPTALGLAITGCGFSLWLGTLIWASYATMRAPPAGGPLPVEAIARIARVLRGMGTFLMGTAAVCFVGELVGLLILTVGDGRSSDRFFLAASLLASAGLALAARNLKRRAHQIRA